MTLDLGSALQSQTVATLKDLISHLPGVDSAGRKDQLIERILVAMQEPGLQAVWSRLDQTQQAAVAEAVHDPRGEYSAQRFVAKYQRAPAFILTDVKSSDHYGAKVSALRLFIHYLHPQRVYYVPTDLLTRLKVLVPVPAASALTSAAELADADTRTTRLTEREALQEVVIMLRTINQARIQVGEKTGAPSISALRLLTEKLAGGDFYPWAEVKTKWGQEVAPIKAFAWPMLLQAAGLATRAGGRLALSAAGVKALGARPEEVLRGLWSKWQKTTLHDEFSRIDAIKGQGSGGRVMTALAPRRAMIEQALQQCPVGHWVELDDFSRFMQADDLDFEVTQDPWKLYLGERRYGSLGYDGSDGWNILQERYIAALLFEYAATLGLVDLAYVDPVGARTDYGDLWGGDDLKFLSRYDGLRAFRVTPLGSYLLGLDATYKPAAVVSEVTLSVLPNLEVTIVGGTLAAEETLLLDNWAQALTAQRWQLDERKALSAVEKGYDIAELRGFLTARDPVPLADAVESFLQRCERNGRALKLVGTAVLIECRDAETAIAIVTDQATAALCMRAGLRMLAVRTEYLEKFRERIRSQGFGLPG